MTQPLEHTGSYYANSINHPTDYPRLVGEHSTDVAVIGGGFTGVSTALHLAERGYRVTLLEANRIGWGASGRNGGQIIGGISGETKIANAAGSDGEQLLWEMRWAGHDIIRERVETYNIQCDLKWGYLDVAIKPRHLRGQEEEMELLSKYNFPHEYRALSASQTHGLIGTDAYIGALLNMGNGHVHPLNLCIGEARAAHGLGAVIHEQSPVVRIDHGDTVRIHTSGGLINAAQVVLAGNAYHFLEPAMRGYVMPVNSFIIATEPLSAEQIAKINPQDLAVCDPNYVLEYFRLSADKRLLFGGRCNYFGDNPENIKAMLRPKMLRIYPELQNTTLDFAWGGTIGVTVNRVPQLGKLTDNIFYSQGYSGHGVNVTHLAGKIMADAVGGTMEKMDIFSRIPTRVIPGAHLLQKPLVSLGMMYFALKDKL